MTATGKTRVFMSEGCQAVILPKAFRMPGAEVSVRRIGLGLLLEPLVGTSEVKPRAKSKTRGKKRPKLQATKRR